MSKKYAEFKHLPRVTGTDLLTPGAACAYLQEQYGLEMRPTTLSHRLNDITHYRNQFNNLGFAFEDLDAYAARFEVTKIPAGSAE